MTQRSLALSLLLAFIVLGGKTVGAQTPYTLSLSNAAGAPGGTIQVPMHLDVPQGALPSAGFRTSIWTPDDQLTPISATLTATLQAFNGGLGPDHNHVHLYFGTGATGVTFGFVFEMALMETLPVGEHRVVDTVWEIAHGAPSTTEIVFCDCISLPPVAPTVLRSDGVEEIPLLVPATITVSPGPVFRRGDANSSGNFNIADAVFTLFYLFSGGPGPCLAALDANGDGSINVSDPLYMLYYINSLGPPPPTPFAACASSQSAFSCTDLDHCP